MGSIKRYADFINEEFDQDTVELVVKLALGTSIFALLSQVFRWSNLSKEKEIQIKKAIDDKIKKDSYMKKISLKLANNEDFQKMILSRGSLSELSHDEMTLFRNDIKGKLGSILTEDEYKYIESVVEDIVFSLKNPALSDIYKTDKKRKLYIQPKLHDFDDEGNITFSPIDDDILCEYGFNKDVERVKSDTNLNIEREVYKKNDIVIYKELDPVELNRGNKVAKYQFKKKDKSYDSISSFKKFLSSKSPYIISNFYDVLEECIKDALKD